MKKKKPVETAPNGTLKSRHSARDHSAYALAEAAFQHSSIPLIDKLEAFPRFTTKRSLARFLAKHEIFKKVLGTTGVIVECGVFNGAGLFTWAQLSNIYEPSNHTRKIIGFDSFEGFPSVNVQMDKSDILNSKPGDLHGSSLDELLMSVEKFDNERQISHIPNIDLIKGDFLESANRFLEANPQLIISLLYLDFDLYEPTKEALKLFLPRIPKRGVVAFDELNCNSFPGETIAMSEVMGIKDHCLNRFPFDPWISYIEL
jgi:hypothetical protein